MIKFIQSRIYICDQYSTKMIKIISFVGLIYVAFSCQIVQNKKQLLDQQPFLVRQVPNGQKFTVGNISDPSANYLYIVNLKGTPHEMGVAYGKLFADQMAHNIAAFYSFFLASLKKKIEGHVPDFITSIVTSKSTENVLKKLLDLNVLITKKYTNPRYYQEIKGMVEGAAGKVKQNDLKRLNIFPELVKAACTVAGVWKNAALNGHTLHVRALDWDYDNPISKYPTISIYHPSDPKLHVHANYGWAGFVGSLTGISDKISLGEKMWWNRKDVKTSRYGNPWTFLFRDVLYQANNISSGIEILTKAHRTCAIFVGMGSVEDHSFRIFQYAYKALNNFDDKNYTHYTANHPKINGVAYVDKNTQPSGDSCVGQVLSNSQFYGKWDAQNLFRYLGLSHQTGDAQLVVFDLQNLQSFVAYSSGDGKTRAYERSPIKLSLKPLFAPF